MINLEVSKTHLRRPGQLFHAQKSVSTIAEIVQTALRVGSPLAYEVWAQIKAHKLLGPTYLHLCHCMVHHQQAHLLGVVTIKMQQVKKQISKNTVKFICSAVCIYPNIVYKLRLQLHGTGFSHTPLEQILGTSLEQDQSYHAIQNPCKKHHYQSTQPYVVVVLVHPLNSTRQAGIIRSAREFHQFLIHTIET